MATDKRRNNGGNSTKAKGADLRKNPYRQAIRDAFGEGEIVDVLRSMYTKGVEEGDVPASKVFLEYTVGKPKDEISLSVDESGISINLRDLLDFG